jgi:hypothetical protein
MRLAVVALALAPLATLVPRAQQQEVAGHTLFVSVFGRNDVPVTDATAANFQVREDNQQRQVLQVRPAPAPTHVALLIDDGRAVDQLSMVQDFRKLLPSVFREAMKVMPGAQVAYWTLGEPPTRRVDFTDNITSIDAALAVFAGRPGPGASLLEAVYQVSGEIRARNAPRAVIVPFLVEDNLEIAERKGEVVETAVKASRASLWSIVLQPQMRSQMGPAQEAEPDLGRGPAGQSMGQITAGMREMADAEDVNRLRDRGYVLGDVSRRSGGVERRVGSKQDIPRMFSRVFTMIASRYEVTYARPAGAPVPKKLEVRLQGKSGTVAAPQWAVQ